MILFHTYSIKFLRERKIINMKAIKKILVLVAVFTTIFSTCHADAIKISNLSAEQFLQSMRNVLFSKDVQENFPIAITNLTREAAKDKNNLQAWSAYFGKQGAENSDGELNLYVDSSNCVHTVKITIKDGENSVTEYSNIFASICNAIGLTQEEGLKLLRGGTTDEKFGYHSEIERSDKIFAVISILDSGITRTLFMADDGNG